MSHIVDAIFDRCDRKTAALIVDHTTISFGELEQLVHEGARALREAGLPTPAQGSRVRVGLHCPNGVDHVVWSLAILRCDAVLVPIAPELSHAERDEVVRTTGLYAVLCASHTPWHGSAPHTRPLALRDFRAQWLTGLLAEPTLADEAALARLHPALIRFSSGTTGQRKGVVLSHDTLLARVTACNAQLGIGPGDKVVWTLPMAHHFAVSIVLYLVHGATTVLAANHSPTEIQRVLAEHRGTVLYGAPYHHALLAAHPETTAHASLRLAVATAAALTADVASRFRARVGVPLVQAMGIIEMGLPLINLARAIDKPTSVGKPQPAFECRVVDESGRDLPAGEPGELLLRGPGGFDAYLAPWIASRDVLRDGWFPTGDVATIDADGDVSLVGRLRAVINVGGMKVFPEEVEAVLLQHPGVAEARVFGMSHPTYGALPVAEIVARDAALPPSSEALDALCREALSLHKIPRKITLAASLPKTPSGKIRRT